MEGTKTVTMSEGAAIELNVKTATNEFTLKGRPCELSAYSFIPTERTDPPQRTAYNTPKKVRQPEVN
jgi:hypothetical protein